MRQRVLWGLDSKPKVGFRMWHKVAFRSLLALTSGVVTLWLAFRPAIANHFGYALPTQNGLPCRIQFADRHYDNDELCAGIDRSAWAVWYDPRHHIAPGGICSTEADLRKLDAIPLREVVSISTLLGPTHSLLVPHGEKLGIGTLTVLFVRDGGCYRVYQLSGGP